MSQSVSHSHLVAEETIKSSTFCNSPSLNQRTNHLSIQHHPIYHRKKKPAVHTADDDDDALAGHWVERRMDGWVSLWPQVSEWATTKAAVSSSDWQMKVKMSIKVSRHVIPSLTLPQHLLLANNYKLFLHLLEQQAKYRERRAATGKKWQNYLWYLLVCLLFSLQLCILEFTFPFAEMWFNCETKTVDF